MVEIIGDKAYTVTKSTVRSDLSPQEEKTLKRYYTEQYRNGCGKQFEKYSIWIEDLGCSLYFTFWDKDNFTIETEQEFFEHENCVEEIIPDLKISN